MFEGSEYASSSFCEQKVLSDKGIEWLCSRLVILTCARDFGRRAIVEVKGSAVVQVN